MLEDRRRLKIMNLQRFFDAAKVELRQYKRTGRVTYLAQSGNKLYNAYVFMLEAYTHRELKHTKEISSAVYEASMKDDNFGVLYEYVRSMHEFFYEMSLDPVYAGFTIQQKIFPLFARIRKRHNLY